MYLHTYIRRTYAIDNMPLNIHFSVLFTQRKDRTSLETRRSPLKGGRQGASVAQPREPSALNLRRRECALDGHSTSGCQGDAVSLHNRRAIAIIFISITFLRYLFTGKNGKKKLFTIAAPMLY